jgi:lysophospholipase L1-like esterase
MTKHEQQISPLARIVGSAIALLAGVVLGVIVLELATRYILDDGMNFDLEMWKYARDLKQKSEYAEIGHEHVANRSGIYMGVPVSINSMGLRDKEYPVAKPTDSHRIIMLGDSLTFGWGVKAEDTPSKLLEARLNLQVGDRRFEVINTGVGNYNSSMEVNAFVRNWSALKPDLVILNYFINDAEPTPRRRENSLLERSAAAVYIASGIDKLKRQYFGGSDWRNYYSGLYSDDAQAWAMNKQAIIDLIAYCKNNNIRIMIINYPELHQLNPYPLEQATATIKSIAHSANVPFVDLLTSVKDFVPETLWVSPTDAHPDKKANEAFAAEIARAITVSFPDYF